MYSQNKIICKQKFAKKGSGILGSVLNKAISVLPIGTAVNRAIDALPIELHIPGYNYCGPGTNLNKRLARGDRGINKLDEACKEHDIAYSKYSDSERRSIADRALAEKAWQRVKSSDTGLGERTAALAVTAAMKAKRAVGGGRRKRRRNVRKAGGGRRTKTTKRCNGCKRKQRRSKKKGRGLHLGPYRNVY